MKSSSVLITALTLYFLVIFAKFIFGDQLYIFNDIGSDTMTIFYPRLLEHLHQYGSGLLSTWSFMRGIGQNIFSNDLFDFTTWPTLFMGPKTIAKYVMYRQLLRIGIALYFIYKILSLRGFSRETKQIAMALFAINGYLLVSSSWYGHTKTIMEFAILLYTVELFLVKGKWWYIPLGMLLMFDAKLLFVVEFLVLYLAMRWADADTLLSDRFKSFLQNGFKAIGITILLVAPFATSLIYKMLYSPRIGGDQSYASQLSDKGITYLESSKHYATAIGRTFAPDMLGGGRKYIGWYNYLEGPIFYIGLLTLVILLYAFYAMSRKQRIAYGLVVFFWFLLVLFPYLRYAFYGFAGDYYKSGVDIFLPFTIWLIAIHGLEHFFHQYKPSAYHLWSGLLFVGVLFLGHTISGMQYNTSLLLVCTVLLLVFSALMKLWTHLCI